MSDDLPPPPVPPPAEPLSPPAAATPPKPRKGARRPQQQQQRAAEREGLPQPAGGERSTPQGVDGAAAPVAADAPAGAPAAAASPKERKKKRKAALPQGEQQQQHEGPLPVGSSGPGGVPLPSQHLSEGGADGGSRRPPASQESPDSEPPAVQRGGARKARKPRAPKLPAEAAEAPSASASAAASADAGAPSGPPSEAEPASGPRTSDDARRPPSPPAEDPPSPTAPTPPSPPAPRPVEASPVAFVAPPGVALCESESAEDPFTSVAAAAVAAAAAAAPSSRPPPSPTPHPPPLDAPATPTAPGSVPASPVSAVPAAATVAASSAVPPSPPPSGSGSHAEEQASPQLNTLPVAVPSSGPRTPGLPPVMPLDPPSSPAPASLPASPAAEPLPAAGQEPEPEPGREASPPPLPSHGSEDEEADFVGGAPFLGGGSHASTLPPQRAPSLSAASSLALTRTTATDYTHEASTACADDAPEGAAERQERDRRGLRERLLRSVAGSVRRLRAASAERRVDATDGVARTREGFLARYERQAPGGARRWEAALLATGPTRVVDAAAVTPTVQLRREHVGTRAQLRHNGDVLLVKLGADGRAGWSRVEPEAYTKGEARFAAEAAATAAAAAAKRDAGHRVYHLRELTPSAQLVARHVGARAQVVESGEVLEVAPHPAHSGGGFGWRRVPEERWSQAEQRYATSLGSWVPGHSVF